MLVHDMFALVSLSVTQKDVWILFASLTKWDTRNSCSGLTSRTRSAVKDHVSASLALNRKNHRKNSKVRGRLHTTSRTFLHVCHKSMVVGCSLLLTSQSRSQCVQSFCAVVNNDFTVGTSMLLHLKVYSAQHVSKNAPHSCHVAPLC